MDVLVRRVHVGETLHVATARRLESRCSMNRTMVDGVAKLAAALRRASVEHGRPNTFAPGELAEYGAPKPMLQGRIAKDMAAMGELFERLGGREVWGSAPRYNRRRWTI